MKEKQFIDAVGRDILIKVSDDHICFYYASEIKHHDQWLQTQEENEIPISDEEQEVNDFYWIDKQHWIDDFTQRLDRPDNFHKHMKRKNWFTEEMYSFINKSCGLK